MRTLKIISALALLLSFIVNISGQRTITTRTMNKQLFKSTIENLVEPNVMGYQFVLIKDGKIVTEGADGQARTGTDGDLKMTTSTPQNIGSLAKFLSGTAMINLFEKPAAKAGSDYKKSTLQGILDRPVWGEFPKVWLDVIPKPGEKSPQERNITYRQLLQHRSGFDADFKSSKNLNGFLEQLDQQFNPAIYNQRKYANMNFTLGGYLLPLIERHNLNFDLDIATGKMSAAQADKYVRDNLGWRMDALMRERIWNKMSPKLNASCDAKKDYKNTGAYGYKSKNEKSGGLFDSMIEMNGHCVGTGGYFMSARDLANYVAHFSQTDLIVTKAGRDAMYREGMPPNDRIVWSSATNDKWIQANFNQSRVAWSDGASDGNQSVLLQLPDNYYLILFVNSPELNSGNLFNIGTLAFKEGMKHNF